MRAKSSWINHCQPNQREEQGEDEGCSRHRRRPETASCKQGSSLKWLETKSKARNMREVWRERQGPVMEGHMGHTSCLEINPIAIGSSRSMVHPGLHFTLFIASVWKMNLNMVRQQMGCSSIIIIIIQLLFIKYYVPGAMLCALCLR